MKIAICDDEELCRKEVIEAANEYISQNENKAIHFEVFSHAEELLEAACKNGGFDIYILDVVMPDMNGIELGEELRRTGYDGRIIYLTSSEEYAVDSYKVKAASYLLKPIDKKAFFSALDESIEAVLEKNGKSIIVKTKENSIRVNFDSIMYAELNRRVIIWHLTNGRTIESVQIRGAFSEAMRTILEDSRFVMCGASMIVNLYHIISADNESVTLKGNSKIYLGRKAGRDVRSAWCEFCLNEVRSK